jgi:polyketide synthase PksN
VRGLEQYLHPDQDREEQEREQEPVAGFSGEVKEDSGVRALLHGPAAETMLQMLVEENNLEKLALLWVEGGRVPWPRLHGERRPTLLRLPTYPFSRQRCRRPPKGWPASGTTQEPAIVHSPNANLPRAPRKNTTLENTTLETILQHITGFLARALHLSPEQITPHQNFHDFGVDSIVALTLLRSLEERFHLKISGRDLLQHHSVASLAARLAARLECSSADGTNRLNTPSACWPEAVDRGNITNHAAEVLERFRDGLLELDELEELIEQGAIV